MAVDRETARGTETVFHSLIPTVGERERVLAALADCVEHAFTHKERWSVTLKQKLIRLNAGLIFVVDIRSDTLRFVVDPARITPEARAVLESVGCTFKSEKFRMFETFEVAYVPAASLPQAWIHLKAASFAAIDGASAWGKSPFKNSHSPGVLKYLAREAGLAYDTETPPPRTSTTSELLKRSYSSANLFFTDEQIANFFTSLQVKGFVILTGISGTGKSKLAQHFVQALGVSSTTPMEHDEVRRIRTKPYMFKHGHFILPRRIEELVEGPEVGKSFEIELEFPGGSERVLLSNRQYKGPPYMVVGLRGSARDWFRDELSQKESFDVFPIENDDGTLRGLRITVDEATAETGARQLFLPVRPDWRDGTDLLGFFNPVTATYETRPFVDFLESALEAWERKETTPYVVLLDEMNLARVEYYFADVLSVLESGRRADGCTVEPIRLTYPEGSAATDAPRRELFIPPNFFIVGTINSDETTHAFSPKVLDRAFSIELNEVDFDQSYGDRAAPLTATEQAVVAKAFTSNGVHPRIDRAASAKLLTAHPDVRTRLQDLTDELQQFEMHFGYRVFDEIVGFLVHAERNGLFGEDWLDDALDSAVLMKVLPKFHGSRAKLEKPLLAMLRWCATPDDQSASSAQAYESLEVVLANTTTEQDLQLPATAARIRRMLISLSTSGFASFG